MARRLTDQIRPSKPLHEMSRAELEAMEASLRAAEADLQVKAERERDRGIAFRKRQIDRGLTRYTRYVPADLVEEIDRAVDAVISRRRPRSKTAPAPSMDRIVVGANADQAVTSREVASSGATSAPVASDPPSPGSFAPEPTSRNDAPPSALASAPAPVSATLLLALDGDQVTTPATIPPTPPEVSAASDRSSDDVSPKPAPVLPTATAVAVGTATTVTSAAPAPESPKLSPAEATRERMRRQAEEQEALRLSKRAAP